jgi:hypothetical protein
MTLIKCSECGREVSDRAAACSQCGAAMAAVAIVDPPLPVVPDAAPVPAADTPAIAPPKSRSLVVPLVVFALFALLLVLSVPGTSKTGAVLPRDEMPVLNINVDLLAQYSVVFAVLVNILGFVIAGYHYSRRGVHPTFIPLKLMWGAGFTFLLLTAFYVHVGYASFRLMHSTVPSEASWYMGLAVVFTATLGRYFLARIGSMLYIIPCIIVGMFWEKGWIEVRPVPQVTAHSFQLPLPAVAFVFGFGLVLAYARLVYPVLIRSVGGGAYQPVVLTVSDEYRALLPHGSYVYEVLTTSDSLYLAVETISFHDKRPPWFSGPYTWRSWHKLESTRYLQFPRSAARCVEYTDPMDVGRPVGGSGMASMPQPPEGPEPSAGNTNA